MIILGTNSIKDTGYDVANSVRFNSGDSPDMLKNLSDGSRTKWTFSTWFKRSKISSTQYLFRTIKDGNSGNYTYLQLNSSDQLRYLDYTSGNNAELKTNRLFRDVSAWYHVCLIIDTTDGTAGDRQQMYINGVRETSFASSSNYSSSFNTEMNVANYKFNIGYDGDNSGSYYDGYLAETVFLDGTDEAIGSFGEFDSDSPTIWKPIDVSGLSGSKGTNGFYLDYEDSSNLGNDVFGGTDFTETNLAAIDQSTDTCTNNFCTMNPLDNYWQGSTFANGNNTVTTVASKENYNTSTLAIPSNDAGKYYCEVKIVSASAYSQIGLADKLTTSATDNFKNHAYGYAYDGATGNILNNDSGSSYGNSYTTDDIIGIAVDTDNNKLYFSKNGTFQNSGDPTSGATGTGAISLSATTTNGYYMFASGTRHNDSLQVSWNFGSPPFAISSGNADANGYGNFEYAVPSGYYSLNTKNLSEYG